MRVCHITSRHRSNDGRIYLRAVTVLRELYGIETFYIANDDGLVEKSEKNILVPKRKGIRERIFTTFQCIFIAISKKPDIIHFHDPEFLAFCWVPKLFRIKTVYDIHENFYEKFEKGGGVYKFLGRSVYSFYELFAFNFIDGIVVVSDGLGKLYANRNVLTKTVRNVPLKSEFEYDNSVIKNEKFTFYSSGQQSEKRRCSQVVKALRHVKPFYPETMVCMAGNFQPIGYTDSLKKLASQLDVQEMIRYAKMLPAKENNKRTRMAHVGLVLYENNINNRIGIPNRLFEYMGAGIPVIVEKLPELIAIVNKYKCGICVDSSNEKELADAMILLINNKDLCEEYGKRGKAAFKEHLNFDEESKQIISLYHTLLS
jgi:glycosyltransferase involved in cell wall biosynthesis